MESERKSRYELFLEEEARKAQPTKQCSKCKEFKAASEFGKRKDRKIGLTPRCKKCLSDANRMYKNKEDRFWKFYWFHVVDVNGCREWTGYYEKAHPVYRWNGNKHERARRVVYQLTYGELSRGIFVSSTCHNPRCVRHSHLVALTKEDHEVVRCNSMVDGDRHGSRTHPDRVPRGERSGSAKLKSPDVIRIRDLYAVGSYSQRELGKMFGVGQTSISAIVRGKYWSHVR